MDYGILDDETARSLYVAINKRKGKNIAVPALVKRESSDAARPMKKSKLVDDGGEAGHAKRNSWEGTSTSLGRDDE